MWIRDSVNSNRFEHQGTEMALPSTLRLHMSNQGHPIQFRRTGEYETQGLIQHLVLKFLMGRVPRFANNLLMS